MIFAEVKEYADKNNDATRLLDSAAKDYSAARCLLLNGHFPGLQIGAQAIEKTLKAILLFQEPRLEVRKLSHDLNKLLTEADRQFPKLGLLRFKPTTKRFRGHFQSRYPDNSDGIQTRGTGELVQLDELIIYLNENLPCPRNVKYRTGLYATITFSLGLGATVTSWEFWIKERNEVLAPLMERIIADYSIVMAELYPEQQRL